MTHLRIAALTVLTALGCQTMPAPEATVILDGPECLRDQIAQAVDWWASEGAAIDVGQVGPCDGARMGECRQARSGEHWAAVVVQDGVEGLCVPRADGSVTYAQVHYDTRQISIGACMVVDLYSVQLLAHELGHVLGLGHSTPGTIMADAPTTFTLSTETQKSACALGWGC